MFKVKCIFAGLILLCLLSSLSLSQYLREGSCPPALPVDACEAECGTDEDCGDNQLCCDTACGGNVCTDPVTKRNNTELVKKGNCPEFPKGPWVCSHTCTSDSDCRGMQKCCPNRCQALACQKPIFHE